MPTKMLMESKNIRATVPKAANTSAKEDSIVPNVCTIRVSQMGSKSAPTNLYTISIAHIFNRGLATINMTMARPKAPTPFLINSDPPTTTSIASANIPPATGMKVLVIYFAARSEIPSAMGAIAPLTTIKPEKTIKNAPRSVTTAWRSSPLNREKGNSCAKCETRPNAVPNIIKGNTR